MTAAISVFKFSVKKKTQNYSRFKWNTLSASEILQKSELRTVNTDQPNVPRIQLFS